jgi:hypothetical protein
MSSESELAPNSRTRRKIKAKPLNNNQVEVVVLQLSTRESTSLEFVKQGEVNNAYWIYILIIFIIYIHT